jgi:hypothetical protein
MPDNPCDELHERSQACGGTHIAMCEQPQLQNWGLIARFKPHQKRIGITQQAGQHANTQAGTRGGQLG